MKMICPNCEKTTKVESVRTREEIKVRGETIEVYVEYYKCLKCLENFDDPLSEYDPLEKAYEEYRRRHDLLQPEQIKNYRKKLGLTQVEMAKILGWGTITLSRYENGCLQDEAHEKAFRLAMKPDNLLALIARTDDVFNVEKKKIVIEKLRKLEKKSHSFIDIYFDWFGDYKADIYSGYRELELAKLFNAIIFFCKGGVMKTVLNKLLFYADFKHFQEYAVSITGARYAHLPYGPVPDDYDLYYATLLNEEKAIAIEEEVFSETIVGEKIIAKKEPNLSLFSETELKILATVKEYFVNFNAKEISEYSHKEKGYEETETGQYISYDYADQLNNW